MKTLVMTAIFAMTSMVNAFSANTEKSFAYNVVMDGEKVETQMVYEVEDGKFLHNHLQYNFKYDAENRLIQKEALKWNEIENAYERYYCLNYNYTEAGADVEYALWDEKANAYSDVREKAVYMQNGGNLNYLGYKWDEKQGDWNLLVEHALGTEDVKLLAIN